MIKPFDVTPEMTVVELLNTCPAAAEIFFLHKMACVGCAMASFESLGDAVNNHGVDFERFSKNLRKTAETAGSNSSTDEED